MRMKGNSLQNCERQDHFGIRKLTIGAASVLLGTTLWLTNANEIVHADENENSGDSEPQEANQSSVKAPAIDADTKVQVQPQNSQVQVAAATNKQDAEIQARPNENTAFSSTDSEKQTVMSQSAKKTAPTNYAAKSANLPSNAVKSGQSTTAKAAINAAQTGNSVLNRQTQAVQKQLEQDNSAVSQAAEVKNGQGHGEKQDSQPDWQKIDLSQGEQVTDAANIKKATASLLTSSNLQKDKNNNQVINHKDYKNSTEQTAKNDSLIDDAKNDANSGSVLNKVSQVVLEPESKQGQNEANPLALLKGNFEANQKKASSLTDKDLAKLLFANSKVSDNNQTSADDSTGPDSDMPNGTVNPVNPTKPVDSNEPDNPSAPDIPAQPTSKPSQPTSAGPDEPDTPDEPDNPSQPTNGPSDQKVTDTVIFTDDTIGKNLKQYSVEGIPGEKVNDQLGGLPTVADTINTYTDQGYTLVSNNYQDTFSDTDQVYNIHLAHKVVTFTGDNPYGINAKATVIRQVNYTVDGVADSSLPSHTETANFSASGHYDLVEHKVVDVDNGHEKVTNGQVDDGHLTWAVDGGSQDRSILIGYAVPTKVGCHVNSVTVDPAADKDANADDTGLVHDLTVNHNSHDITVTISLMRDTNSDTIYVDYHDEQGQVVGSRQVITGPIGQTISVETGVPDGWQVKPNTPFNYDFEQNYTTVTVTVDPVQAVINADDITPDRPFKGTILHDTNNADLIPGTKNKHISGDITYDDLHKQAQRSIVIVDPNGALDKNSIMQIVDFKRNATINAVTGKITFGQWQVDGKDNFKGITVPVFKGYTASQTSVIPINNVTSNFEDPHLLITYKANDNQQNIKYEDEAGKVIATQVVKGKTDQTVPLKADIPDGWQLATGQNIPNEVKVAGDDAIVKIVPQVIHIDPDDISQTNPLKATDVLPGTREKHAQQDIAYQDLHKDITRTILIKNPKGDTDTVVQTVHLHRSATVNAANGKVDFGQWTAEENDNLPSYAVPEIPGYTATQNTVAAVNNVAADYTDPKVQISYTPVEGQQTINYADDQGHIISCQVVKGKTDENVSVPEEKLDGYHIVKSPVVPSGVIIKAEDQAINVVVVPNHAEIKADDVTANKPFKKTDVLPGTINKHAQQDITYNDLHKDVTRQISVTLPNGQKQNITQSVHFKRNANVNDATGEVKYGQWQADGNNNLAALNLPQINGYLATGLVPAVENVNSDDQNQQLSINYVKDTPANRLKIAAANLAASQTAQVQANQRLAEAQKKQEAAHQEYEANQADLQKQTALVTQLNEQALSAKTFLTNLMADNSSSLAAKKARENLAVLMAKLTAANQRIEQDQKAINTQKNKAQTAQNAVENLKQKKTKVDTKIIQLEKDIPEAAQVLDNLKKEKGYQLEITKDYAQAVSAFVQGAKADYENHKSIKDDSKLNEKFHADLQKAGQAILEQMANNYSKPGAINLTENADKIDLSKILPAEKNGKSNETWNKLNQETTAFAFTLLNSVRAQLELEPLTLNKTAMQMAAEVAQNYYNDGKSDFNNEGHDAEAVNKAAKARNLQYVQNYGTDDPHSSHDQYYEALAGGFAKGKIKVVLPEENGNGYGITFGLPASKDNSYETNLDSLKQAIFGNLAEMLLVDGHSGWGHTIQLLNIGGYQDYGQKHPIYRFGASMHLLDGELDKANGAKYSNHYIVIPPHFMQAGEPDKFKDTDEKGPQNNFDPTSLTKQQQNYANKERQLNNLLQEQASLAQQIREQSLAQKDANNIVNKLQADLIKAQNEKKSLTGQEVNAQTRSNDAANKLAQHEQAIKDAQSKMDAADKAAQEAEAKKEEMERKADASKLNEQEFAQKVKDRTSQLGQKQQQTKEAVLIYQNTQNTGSPNATHNGSGSNSSAIQNNSNNSSQSAADSEQGQNNNSAVKNDDDASADDQDEPDEPDGSDDNDYGDDADGSDSSVSDRKVQGENLAFTHRNSASGSIVHSQREQSKEAMPETIGNFTNRGSALPQTGENEDNSVAAALAGAAAVSISLIGLAGVKKKRRAW